MRHSHIEIRIRRPDGTIVGCAIEGVPNAVRSVLDEIVPAGTVISRLDSDEATLFEIHRPVALTSPLDTLDILIRDSLIGP